MVPIVGARPGSSGSLLIYNDEPRYCIYRDNDQAGANYICCDGCSEWYHYECLRIPVPEDEKDCSSEQQFYCLFCKSTTSQEAGKAAPANAQQVSSSHLNCTTESNNRLLSREERLIQLQVQSMKKSGKQNSD